MEQKYWFGTITGLGLGAGGWVASHWQPILGALVMIAGGLASLMSIRASRAARRTSEAQERLAQAQLAQISEKLQK